MSRSRNVERVLLVALVAIGTWQAWSLRRAKARLLDAEIQLQELDVRTKMIVEAQRARVSVPLPSEMFRPEPQARAAQRGGRGGFAGAGGAGGAAAAQAGGAAQAAANRPGPGAQAKEKVPPVPGSMVLNKLYDAADDLAMQENWDGETYDAVARVFEDTNRVMTDLWQDIKDREVNVGQARQRALRIRDHAQDRLVEVLGEDGLERLKGEIKDEMPVMPQR